MLLALHCYHAARLHAVSGIPLPDAVGLLTSVHGELGGNQLATAIAGWHAGLHQSTRERVRREQECVGVVEIREDAIEAW